MTTLLILLALALLTLFAYVDRLYTEMGKFFLRGVQDNLEVFEKKVEPSLKMDRGRAGLAFVLLSQGAILILAVLTSYVVFRQQQLVWKEVLEAVLLLLVAVVFFGHMIPHVLITRTRGEWVVHFVPLLRLAILLVLPAVAVLSFSFGVAALSRMGAETKKEEDAATEGMEALMDKGEEHGILEEEDRELIQSVVEFGDKTVREVMTPRPKIVAVDQETTLEELLHAVAEKPYSRIPVYQGTLDNIEGFVYTRDLIQLTDVELKQMKARERMRPVPLAPETKKVADLMRELQQQNLHMAIVVDEYGSVAGLATMEDMVEEIVGEIRDESEKQQDVLGQSDGSYLVSGQANVDVLEELFDIETGAAGDAATVAGLVNSIAGHVPQRGETLEFEGLRFEVVQSSDQLVERLRVSRA